jgi:ABC-type phosphate/phosphonate transport system ATPase subunit
MDNKCFIIFQRLNQISLETQSTTCIFYHMLTIQPNYTTKVLEIPQMREFLPFIIGLSL